MKTKRLLYIILLAFLISAGGFVYNKYFRKYADYKESQQGIYYKLHKFGENQERASVDDYITVDLNYKTITDSIFFKGRRKFQLTKPEFTGVIEECFMMLAEGDSASFIISADKFFIQTLQSELPSFIAPDSDMKVDVLMLDIRTQELFEKEKKEFLTWISDIEEYEDVLLDHYIEENVLGVAPSATGLFHLVVQEGTGEKVERGDTICIHYEGKFLNGDYFDSTRKRNTAFEFVYGQEWQVIKGLEEGLGHMREGERAIFVMPSELAFGNNGSSTGIIPPFTSIIFEVEMISVR